MKLLISAYACEPNKGSEPEVGWRYALKSSKLFDEVVVVTRTNNKPAIEEEVAELNVCNLKFIYFDLPNWLYRIKKYIGVQLYAYLWEVSLFCFLKKNYYKREFDVVQRVTFVSYRFPSFIWYFGKKFIFGPIAGGERYPLNFLKIMTFKAVLKEVLRAIVQRMAIFDPFVRLTLSKADEIIAVTEDSKTILPRKYWKKVKVEPAITIDINDFEIKYSEKKQNQDVIKLLYVGRILQWKGLMLTLMSLKRLESKVNYVFNIVGDGPDRNVLEMYVSKNNLNVNFLGSIKRCELSSFYLSHDVFVFPSLHDSGGMVVLEAKAHGLKVITSSFGGPKQFIEQSDYLIESVTVNEFVEELSEAISKN